MRRLKLLQLRAKVSYRLAQLRLNYKIPYVRTKSSVSFMAVVVMSIFAILLQPIAPLVQTKSLYEVPENVMALLDDVPNELVQSQEYDQASQAFVYMPDQIESANHKTGSNGSEFSSKIYVDPNKGAEITDKASNLSIAMVPKFKLHEGSRKDGHVIYPLKGRAGWLAYTLQYNGVKEDILLPHAPAKDELSFEYELRLPDQLEARLEQNGSVGIYGPDSVLLGDVKTSTEADKNLIQKAQKNADKTQLMFVIPAPEIIGDQSVEAYFELNGNSLSLYANNLLKAQYPLSIDPSVAIPSMANFDKNASGTGFITIGSSQLQRSQLSGGFFSESPWDGHAALAGNGVYLGSSIVYKNYLYVLGGLNALSTHQLPVLMAEINQTTGALGSWQNLINVPENGIAATDIAVYNGYMYIVSGHSSNENNETLKTYYSKINDDGTLAGWVQSTNVTCRSHHHRVNVHNGFIYKIGGVGCVNYRVVESAPILPDGSLGTWTQTTLLPEARFLTASFVWQDYMYVLGGCASDCQSGSIRSAVHFAKLNGDGTVGAWSTTTSLTSATFGGSAEVMGGYVYYMGGCTGTITVVQTSCNSFSQTTMYAEINADGTLGAWVSTEALDNQKMLFNQTAVYENKRIYYAGGCRNSYTVDNSTCANTDIANGVYSNIATTAGDVTTSTNTTSLPAARNGHGVVAHNGYIYVAGGCTTAHSDCDTNGEVVSTVYLAQVNTNGTISSWSTTSALPNARGNGSLAIYNGYLYWAGGSGNCGLLTAFERDCAQVYYASINDANGTIGAWSTTTSLPTGMSRHASIAYNGYLYALGGYDSTMTGNDRQNVVRYAPINTNGTIGSWSTTSSFSSGREFMGIDIYAGRMYIAGGFGTGAPLGRFDDVQSASINTNGTLNAWSNAATMPAGSSGLIVTIYNGVFYAISGYDANVTDNFSNKVFFATVNSDGSIGTFSTSDHTVNTKRRNIIGPGAVVKGRVYLPGGQGVGGPILSSVEFMKINNGGSGAISSFSSTTNSFAQGRKNHCSVVHNGYIYVLGGYDDAASPQHLNSVQYAQVQSNGDVGAWSATTAALNVRRANFGCWVHNNFVYVAGGITDSGSPTNTVHLAALQSNGDILSWSASSNPLPTIRSAVRSVTRAGYVYLFSGDTNEVLHAQIQATNDVGTWTATTSLPAGVEQWVNAPIIVDKHIYLFGTAESASVSEPRVYFATINSNGTLSTWTKTTDIPYANTHHGNIYFYNGYFYYRVGYMGGAGTNSVNVMRAARHSSGHVSDWERVYRFTDPIGGGDGVQYNGRLYITGGCGPSGTSCGVTASTNTFYSTIPEVIHRKGSYTQLLDMKSPQGLSRFMQTQTNICQQSVRASYKHAVTGTSVFEASQNINNWLENSKYYLLTPTKRTSRFVEIKYSMDDSLCASFGNGNSSVINSYELFYKASPSSRLRGGKNFMNGYMRQHNTEQGATTN